MRTKKLDRSFQAAVFLCAYLIYRTFLEIRKIIIISHILRKFVLEKEIYIVDLELYKIL